MHTVLLADDEPTIIEGLRQLFDWERAGFKIIATASDGDEAFEKIIGLSPDLVLTDIRMPGMNGIELIKALKTNGTGCEVIIISGYDDFNYCLEALRLGVNDYMLKPIDFSMLGEKVLKIAEALSFKKKQNGSSESIPQYTKNPLINEIRNYIKLHYTEDLTLQVLAQTFHLNPSYLCRVFKEKHNINLIDYINRVRIENAKLLVESTARSVNEIAEMVGFSDYRYFTRVFKKYEGIAPQLYRKKANEKEAQ